MKNTISRSRRFFFRASALAALALPLAAALAPSARAETVWAKGVSWESGWFDTNKIGDASGNPFKGEDTLMCWAAAASNVVAWWQAQAPASAVPAGTPIGNDAVYAAFRNNFKNTAKGADIAWKWYFGGCDLVASNYASDFLSTVADPKKSGRYWEEYVESKYAWPSVPEETPAWIYSENLADVSYDQRYAGSAASELARLLSDGYGVVLSLVYNDGNPNYDASGHLVTLWGLEYEGETLKTLYITDSDDQSDGIFSLSMTPSKTTVPTSEDGKTPAWDKYSWTASLSGTVTLSRYGALMLPVPVPEPSAFALLAGLGALALAGTRRRRKKA